MASLGETQASGIPAQAEARYPENAPERIVEKDRKLSTLDASDKAAFVGKTLVVLAVQVFTVAFIASMIDQLDRGETGFFVDGDDWRFNLVLALTFSLIIVLGFNPEFFANFSIVSLFMVTIFEGASLGAMSAKYRAGDVVTVAIATENSDTVQTVNTAPPMASMVVTIYVISFALLVFGVYLRKIRERSAFSSAWHYITGIGLTCLAWSVVAGLLVTSVEFYRRAWAGLVLDLVGCAIFMVFVMFESEMILKGLEGGHWRENQTIRAVLYYHTAVIEQMAVDIKGKEAPRIFY